MRHSAIGLICLYRANTLDQYLIIKMHFISHFCLIFVALCFGGAVQPPLMQINQKWFDKLIAFGLKLH